MASEARRSAVLNGWARCGLVGRTHDPAASADGLHHRLRAHHGLPDRVRGVLL